MARKRKPGKRTKCGRLVVLRDYGTERVQAMQALYGADGADAIGRAYRAGLLGEGQDAKALLDTARRLSNAYWRAYEQAPYTCTLSDRSGGSCGQIDHDRVRRQEEWLADSLRFVDRMGADVRRAFDQFVIDPNPDSGPVWMDRLLWEAQRNKPHALGDTQALRKALDALEHLAG